MHIIFYRLHVQHLNNVLRVSGAEVFKKYYDTVHPRGPSWSLGPQFFFNVTIECETNYPHNYIFNVQQLFFHFLAEQIFKCIFC